jgi:hypothetical protein
MRLKKGAFAANSFLQGSLRPTSFFEAEPPAGEVPLVSPGAGFVGATAQPATQGTRGDLGWLDDVVVGETTYERTPAKPIAHWDTVQFLDIAEQQVFGVAAFHIAGINRVEFSLDGGDWVSVTSVSTNPDTGVPAYLIRVDSDDLSNGRHELRAIVYPNRGDARVLQGENVDGKLDDQISLFIWKNPVSAGTFYVSTTGNDETGDGTQGNPYKTIVNAIIEGIGSSGSYESATIKLMTGDHTYGFVSANGGALNSRPSTAQCTGSWLTIEPADGASVSLSSCYLALDGSYANDLLLGRTRYRNIPMFMTRLDGQQLSWRVFVNDPDLSEKQAVCFDSCQITGDPDYWQTIDKICTGDFTYTAIVSCNISQVPRPAAGFHLVRDCNIDFSSEDVFSQSRFVVNTINKRNTRVFNRDPNESTNSFHNDFAQFQTTDSSLGFDNFLFLNVIGIDQANCFLRLQEVSQVVNGVRVARPLSNFGFINVVYAPGTLENSPSSNSEKRSSSKNHIVFENCTILTAVNFLTKTVSGVDYPLHGYYDIAVRNSVFSKVDPNFSGGTWSDRSPESGWSFGNNHWLNDNSTTNTIGTDFTNPTNTGDVLNAFGLANGFGFAASNLARADAEYTDAAGFKPTSSSVLANRGARLRYFDALMADRNPKSSAIGALEQQ